MEAIDILHIEPILHFFPNLHSVADSGQINLATLLIRPITISRSRRPISTAMQCGFVSEPFRSNIRLPE